MLHTTSRWAWILCLAALLSPAAGAQLVNGGAESGTLLGWVPDLSGAPTGNSSIIKSVTTQVQTAPPVFPDVGSRFFSFATQVAGAPGSFVELSQLVPLGAPSAPRLALNGRIQTEFGDLGDASIELLDAGGGVLAGNTLTALVSDGNWSSFYVDAAWPVGAAQCRVRLRGTVVTGMAVNVFWDELRVAPSPWSSVGPGLAGTFGVPVIAGSGPLLANEPFAVALSNARPSTTAWLVVGFAPLMAPFKGGVMVPSIDLLRPRPTGAPGATKLGGAWPAGVPSGTNAWFQWWVQDPVGVLGFASTTGLLATTP